MSLKKMDFNNSKVKKWYHNDKKVFSAGNTVTYVCNGVSYTEEVDEGASCLAPTTFKPSSPGAAFLGWSASAGSTTVLTSKIMAGDPVKLYAVWRASGSATVYGTYGNRGSASVTIVANGPNNATVYETLRGWRTFSQGSEYNYAVQHLKSVLGDIWCGSNPGNNNVPTSRTATRSVGTYKSLTYTVTADSEYSDDWYHTAAQGTATITWVG